mmetsp:Transcript_44228/g.122606  ORF Transcript_44228/g.122606 Transcript_44228/m.122606 type:complete len:304 (-) Transcript_44228:327-1238(-)
MPAASPARSSRRRTTRVSHRSLRAISRCTASICESIVRSAAAAVTSDQPPCAESSTQPQVCAKRSAWRVSVACAASGRPVTITTERPRPPSEGASSIVSLSSWKGTYERPWCSAMITFLSASSPRLMLTASCSRSPVALDFLRSSQPPRSARVSVARTVLPSAARCTRLSISRQCARDERSFISVAARRLASSASRSKAAACAVSSTTTSARPFATARAATPCHAPMAPLSLSRSLTVSPKISTTLMRSDGSRPAAARCGSAASTSATTRGTRPAEAGSCWPRAGRASLSPHIVCVLPEPVCP